MDDEKGLKETQDYEAMKNAALRHIQEISRNRWTDFNLHDPGVTILEALCFSLSDLGYRTDFPMSDLLTTGKDDLYPTLGDAFFLPEDILPYNPTNEEEYRKLIMEFVPGLHNVWVNTTKEELNIPEEYRSVFGDDNMKINVACCYDIRLEKKDFQYIEKHILSDRTMCGKIGLVLENEVAENHQNRIEEEFYDKWLINYTKRLLLRHRNINERFLNVSILNPIDVNVDISITSSTNDFENIVGEMYERLNGYVTPSLKLYSVQDLMEKGRKPEEIYQGYFDENENQDQYKRLGVVDMCELKSSQRRLMLRKSDMFRIVSKCEGVENVISVDFRLYDECVKKDSLGHYIIEPNSDCCFRLKPFFYDGNEMDAETSNRLQTKQEDVVKKYLLRTNNSLLAKRIKGLSDGKASMLSLEKQNELDNRIIVFQESRKFVIKLKPNVSEPNVGKVFNDASVDISYPLMGSKYRNVGAFHSFQNLLPKIFKMRACDVPSREDSASMAARLQLKSYLNVFDKFIENYLLQLKYFRYYFCIDDENKTDDDFDKSDFDEVRGATDINYIEEQRNRLLDRILAIYNEKFDEIVPLIDMNWVDRFDGEAYLKESIRDKTRLIKDYASLNRNRTLGMQRTAELSVSGIERRILAKLGVNDPKAKLSPYLDEETENFSDEFEKKFGIHIIEHSLLIPKRGLTGQSFLEMTEIESETPVNDPYSYYVTVLYPGELRIFSSINQDFRNHVRNVIRDELPAHVDAITLGISNGKMKQFEKAYEDYLKHLAREDDSDSWRMIQYEHIVRLNGILIGLEDTHGDKNHVRWGIRLKKKFYRNTSSLSVWNGVDVFKMLDSIDRSRVRKGDKIKNISKMIAETMNDGDLLNFIWDLLGQNDEMLREFEYLATHADMPGWRKRLEDFAENLNQELLSCEDVNHDEKNNNVVWNILRPAKHQQKVTRMPVSHHWLGLSIAGILRSINRNLV